MLCTDFRWMHWGGKQTLKNASSTWNGWAICFVSPIQYEVAALLRAHRYCRCHSPSVSTYCPCDHSHDKCSHVFPISFLFQTGLGLGTRMCTVLATCINLHLLVIYPWLQRYGKTRGKACNMISHDTMTQRSWSFYYYYYGKPWGKLWTQSQAFYASSFWLIAVFKNGGRRPGESYHVICSPTVTCQCTSSKAKWCVRPILHSVVAKKLGQVPAKSYTKHMKHPQTITMTPKAAEWQGGKRWHCLELHHL